MHFVDSETSVNIIHKAIPFILYVLFMAFLIKNKSFLFKKVLLF